MSVVGGKVVATYDLILDFKAKFFKRSHCDTGINSVWESIKLSAPGIDYHMVIFYKFGNTEKRPKFFTSNMNNLISMYEHFQMNSAPPKIHRKIQRNKHMFNS